MLPHAGSSNAPGRARAHAHPPPPSCLPAFPSSRSCRESAGGTRILTRRRLRRFRTRRQTITSSARGHSRSSSFTPTTTTPRRCVLHFFCLLAILLFPLFFCLRALFVCLLTRQRLEVVCPSALRAACEWLYFAHQTVRRISLMKRFDCLELARLAPTRALARRAPFAAHPR